MIDFIKACQTEEGGFAGNIRHDPNITNSLYSVLILSQFGAVNEIDREKCIEYVASLQNEDGSFSGDKWGEVDS